MAKYKTGQISRIFKNLLLKKRNSKKFIIFIMITSFIVVRMPNMRSSLLDF